MHQDYQYLTVPGLAGSGLKHWQTIWENKYLDRFKRVEQANWDWPERDIWIERLQEEIESQTKPVILVAHSLGCLTVVHWANHFSNDKVAGAMLVAPADAEKSRRLSFVKDFAPIPVTKLPFSSVVVASTDDIYDTWERSHYFAELWGSDLVNVGQKGHINALSGLGDWPEGIQILQSLTHLLKVNV